MLRHLFVKDLAIVSTLDLDISEGMTALTGETGAGKSILIDALGLALGDRGEASMIRAGQPRAEISASFDPSRHEAVQTWLVEQGLDEAGECVLRRLLEREGRSRGFINGRPATLRQLQSLGALLVAIHGQHAHQSLPRPGEQRRLLDEYAGAGPLALGTAHLFRRFRDAARQLEGLENAAQERAERLDLLRFQRAELEALGTNPEEVAHLDQEQRRLRNIGRLQADGARLLRLLYDDEGAVGEALDQAVARLDDLLEFSPRLGEARELLEGARIQVQEAASALRDFAEGLELDPNRLERVEQRLTAIHEAARKYRVNPEALPQRLEAIRQALAELEGADLTLERLTQEVAQSRADFLASARELGERRRAAGVRLEEEVSASMQTLGMRGGRFQVRVSPLAEDQAGPGGLETVDFLVSANPGQPPQPLAKVASGGELSRISLALQVATVACGPVPTLIFDEVDVGIGGRVAEIVGQLLARLGDARQVLCVTHLPQVAAQAHHHLQVSKFTEADQTHIRIQPLAAEERVEEVARMLGGLAITRKTLEHAREMLGTGVGKTRTPKARAAAKAP